jgi:hypothetical protein
VLFFTEQCKSVNSVRKAISLLPTKLAPVYLCLMSAAKSTIMLHGCKEGNLLHCFSLQNCRMRAVRTTQQMSEESNKWHFNQLPLRGIKHAAKSNT